MIKQNFESNHNANAAARDYFSGLVARAVDDSQKRRTQH
jgi:hypothetical protein